MWLEWISKGTRGTFTWSFHHVFVSTLHSRQARLGIIRFETTKVPPLTQSPRSWSNAVPSDLNVRLATRANCLDLWSSIIGRLSSPTFVPIIYQPSHLFQRRPRSRRTFVIPSINPEVIIPAVELPPGSRRPIGTGTDSATLSGRYTRLESEQLVHRSSWNERLLAETSLLAVWSAAVWWYNGYWLPLVMDGGRRAPL